MLKVLSILLFVYRVSNSFTALTLSPFLCELLLLKVLSILLYVYRVSDSFTAQSRPPFLYELLLLKVLSILSYVYIMADSFTALTLSPILYELLLLKVLSILLYVYRVSDSFTAQTRPQFLYELLLLKFLSILLYVFRMADSLVSRHGASDEYHDPYCEPCDESRGKNVKAKCFCKNCYQFLCTECHTVHGRLMATKCHVIQTGADMPPSMADKPPRYELCDDHPKCLKDQFCYHHGVLICSMCCSASHSMCDTKNVVDTCKYIQLSEVDNLCDANKSYRSQLSKLLSSVDKRGGKLIDQRQTLLKDAKTAYDKIIAEINRSYQNMKTVINAECDLQDKTVSQLKQEIKSQISQVDAEINFTNKVRGKPINVNTFLSLQESVSKTRKCVVVVKNLKESLNLTSLIFEPSKDIQILLSKPLNFGSLNKHHLNVDVDVSTQDINFPSHIKGSTRPASPSNRGGLPGLKSTKSSFGQIKARHIGTYDVRTKEDRAMCGITGVAITSCGQKLFVDNNNDRVKLFSQDMRFLSSVQVHAGWDITMLNDMEAVVTQGHPLVFLEVANEKLRIKQTINLSFDGYGITHSKDNLICTDSQQLHVIDRQGSEQLLGGQSSFRNSIYICSNSDGRWIVATDIDKNTITVLDANNGAVITSRQLKETTGWVHLGVAVDTSDNIFVCGYKEMIVMSGDLKNERVLFNIDDNKPQAIAYDGSKHQLIISQCYNDSVCCLQLS